MAYEIPGFSFPLPAGADFSAGAQFRFCDVNNVGKVVNPANAGSVIGVRQNRAKLNEAATVVHNGVSIVEAGGAITAGALVMSNAVGQAVTASGAAASVAGRALETSTGAGVQIAVLLIPGTVAAS